MKYRVIRDRYYDENGESSKPTFQVEAYSRKWYVWKWRTIYKKGREHLDQNRPVPMSFATREQAVEYIYKLKTATPRRTRVREIIEVIE